MTSEKDGTSGIGARRLRSFSPWHGTASPTAEISVLVVDPQRVSRRFVELALTGKSESRLKAVVESVADAASAFDVLKVTLVDVILSEVDLPDMSGLRFCRLLRQEGRLQDIPVIFVSADDRVETRVVALSAGADDYLVKPCVPSELAARVSVATARRARATAARRNRTYTLGGDFSTLTLPDLVSILEVSRRTGVLSVVTRRAFSEILLDSGRVVHATFGNLSGSEAFFRLIAEPEGQFEFNVQPLLESSPRTIDDTVTGLLMEAARRMDHGELGPALRDTPSKSKLPLDLAGGAPVRISERLTSPLVATDTLGSQFELAIADEFSLGELLFFGRKDLLDWTQNEIGRARLHVHLVADLTVGVSSLLSMASPPGERWVRAALEPEQKVLALAFFMRHELLLDVTLLDIRRPTLHLEALRRTPTLMVLAPPDGDPLALGPASLVELDTLMRRLAPSVIVRVARSKIGGSASSSTGFMAQLPGALGERKADLRTILVEGVRCWAKTQRASPPEKMA